MGSRKMKSYNGIDGQKAAVRALSGGTHRNNGYVQFKSKAAISNSFMPILEGLVGGATLGSVIGGAVGTVRGPKGLKLGAALGGFIGGHVGMIRSGRKADMKFLKRKGIETDFWASKTKMTRQAEKRYLTYSERKSY